MKFYSHMRKRVVGQKSQREMDAFRVALEECELQDLGFEEMCPEVVKIAWEEAMGRGETGVHAALKVVAGGLGHWSRNILGDLEKSMKFLKKQLELCWRGAINPESVAREGVLRFKLERVEE